MSSTSSTWGWTPERLDQLAQHEEPGLLPGRVARVDRAGVIVALEDGARKARVPRHLHDDPPTVGDFVGLREGEPPTVAAVLPRATAFVRAAAGRATARQVVAANVDVVLLVAGLDGDLNLRRLERYLVLAHESGARPVVVLNKADVAGALDKALAEVHAVARGVDVLAVSATTGQGMDALRARLRPGETAAFLGSSGVGKTSLVGRLLGDGSLRTGALRTHDGRGRHTTTARHLLPMPGGALLLDTPGMRELHLLDAEAGVSATFDDVEALARACRFRDCAHGAEPGCVVRAAREAGELDDARWSSYQKLRREAAAAAMRADAAEARAQARRAGRLSRASAEAKRARRGDGW